jgi:hypothetical protein
MKHFYFLFFDQFNKLSTFINQIKEGGIMPEPTSSVSPHLPQGRCDGRQL